ncbi:MAG: hypothetical protein R3F20_04025 [Planctomycetota bacterium]
MAFRRKGDDVAFRVHYGVSSTTSRAIAWYRDPSVEFDFGDLQTLEVERSGFRTTRLERLGGRWTVRGPDGVSHNGEQTNCDRFAAGVLSLSARAARSGPRREIPRESPHTRFTIRTVDGRTGRSTSSRWMTRGRRSSPRADDPELRLGGRDAWRVLPRTSTNWRRRKLLEVEHEITALEIEREDRLPTLKLKHWNRTAWYLKPRTSRIRRSIRPASRSSATVSSSLRHRTRTPRERSPAHWLVRVPSTRRREPAAGGETLGPGPGLVTGGPLGRRRGRSPHGARRSRLPRPALVGPRPAIRRELARGPDRRDHPARRTRRTGPSVEIGISDDGERNEWHLGERTVPDDFVPAAPRSSPSSAWRTTWTGGRSRISAEEPRAHGGLALRRGERRPVVR